MNENKVVVLIGFSACGKDTIQNKFNDVGYTTAISHTTRPMREGEKQGRDYHFVDKNIFIGMEENNAFVGRCRKYNTLVDDKADVWCYGSSKYEMDKPCNQVTILDLCGAEAMKKYLGDRMISIFIMVDEKTRKKRCVTRGDFNKVEWERRAEDDRNIFKGVKQNKIIDLIVENKGDVDECFDKIFKFVENSIDK